MPPVSSLAEPCRFKACEYRALTNVRSTRFDSEIGGHLIHRGGSYR